ncbi:MAG: transcriptional regulator [Flavobacteriales bacterium]|nr:MAG: transcriptional regulator [Flavobacteriales bacterium]
MLSKSCVYALRSLVFVAHNASCSSKIGIKEIAKELDLPTPYLGKILQQLTKHKIIQSIKGPNGGFYIDEESQKIKLITIIEVFDGLDFFNRCGLGLKECSEEHPCPLHDDFKIYRERLLNLFSSKSIADMVSKIEVGDAFIQNLSRGLV